MGFMFLSRIVFFVVVMLAKIAILANIASLANNYRELSARTGAIVDAPVLELLGLLLGLRRKMPVEVLLHDETADGHAVMRAETAVLDVDRHGDAGLLHRGKAHEGGMVDTAVLCRAGLAANLVAGDVRPRAGAAEHGLAHAGHDVGVPFRVDHRSAAAGIEGVDALALHGMHDVGDVIVATVGDGGAEVGDLQGSGSDLALPDGDGDDGERVPRAAVCLVVVVGVGNHAAPLAGKVDAELVTEAHLHQMVLPPRHGALHGAVFAAVGEHTHEVPAEEGVARCAECGDDGHGRGVGVATEVQALVVEAAGAGEGGVGVYGPFLQADEPLRGLEGGARGVAAHDGTVEERAHGVGLQGAVVLATVAADHLAGVVGGRRRHAEDFAGGRLDGHDGAELALEQALGQGLEVEVDAQGEVAPRHRRDVVHAILVVPLRAAVDIAEHDAHPLLAAQHFLIRTLDAELADVVAAAVIVVGIDVGLADLADIAQDMGRPRPGIAAHGALLGREPIEAEEFLPNLRKLFRRDLAHEELGSVAGITGMLVGILDVRHAGDVLLAGNAHGVAEIEGVDTVLVLHDDIDVVRRFVVDHEASLAVEDETARGEEHFLAESIGVGTPAVVVAEDLQGEDAHGVQGDDGNGHRADDVLPLFKTIILGHGLRNRC